MTYGLTAEGFVRKHLATIEEDLKTAIKDEFGEDTDFGTDSVFGKITGALAQPIADLWELLQEVYGAFYPNMAQGVSLDNCCDLVGVERQPATRSEVIGLLIGLVGTTITGGSVVSTDVTENQFGLQADVTLSATGATGCIVSVQSLATGNYTITINSTPFTYAATVPPDDEDDIIAALVSAINGGSEPVTATDLGDQTIQLVGDDVDSDSIPDIFNVSLTSNLQFNSVTNIGEFEGVETGPVTAYAGKLINIVTPISGWTAVTNPIDAELGEEEETDAELRARRAYSLAVPGAGTVDSIRSNLLQVTDVDEVLVIENTTDSTVDSIPPHAFEAIVLDGDDADIAQDIWDHKPAGIATYGSESATVSDDQGFEHVVYFSRPTERLMWINVEYSLLDAEEGEEFPDNGVDLIKAAALSWGQAHEIGNDVLPQRLYGPIFGAVGGIESMTIYVKLDGGSYQTTPYEITFRQIAIFDSGRIETAEV